jgi:hypothetical protein
VPVVPVAISQRTLTQAHIEDTLPISLIYSPSLKRRRKQREEKRLVEEYARLSLITNYFENAQIDGHIPPLQQNKTNSSPPDLLTIPP